MLIRPGSDLSIVNAARRSFNTRSTWENDADQGWGKAPKLQDKDERLLKFLARGMTEFDFEVLLCDIEDLCDSCEYDDLSKDLWKWRNTPTHDTPFNHTFISFEVKAPIFVRAQLVKHEYLIMSEFSRRYKTDDIEFYKPDVWRKAATDKKQGSLDEPVELHPMSFVVDPLDDHQELNEAAFDVYLFLLQQGVAPEQARMVLPQSTMTEWTWSGTLGAFAKMCTLRLHPEAQYEARLVAGQVYGYLKQYYPVAAPALVEGV